LLLLLLLLSCDNLTFPNASVQYKCSQLASTFIFHILQCTFQRLKDTNRYCALTIIKFLYDKVNVTFLFFVTITIIDFLAEIYIIQVYII